MTSSTYTTGSGGTQGESGSQKVEELARRHRSLVTLARVGWVAKGVVYLLVGLLAVPIALQGAQGGEDAASGGNEASQVGAVAEIADSPLGTVALWAIAIGLALYVLWRLVSIALPADNTAEAWLTRAGYLVSAVLYSTLAWAALSFATAGGRAGGSESEDAKVERFTRELMERSGGRWLVGLVGVAVIAVGVFFVVKGVQASFRDELEPRGVGPLSHEAIVTLGRVGWAGRGAVMALVGWFLVRAALDFDPQQAAGIDGALREVTGSTLGTLLVWFVALGLIVYGLFCVVSAPRQRLKGAS